ncbi:hypothetical protein SCUCBS95973_009462 [Sporothrix curviconia]|uniref:Uncharacterized protein n=1 Tax=Sporothrix curviconia TaxID=1260050 RepID=A0ABP0CV58_9PEZI
MGSQPTSPKTLLEVLEDHINSLPIRCHDQTSNQRIVHEAIADPVNATIVEKTVGELKGQPWDEVYVLALARIAATVLPVISGMAGMFAISIYFNEPGAHGDASIWPDVADPATEHPMAARHLLIRHAYNQLTAKTGQSTP